MSGRQLDNWTYLNNDWEDEVESKNKLKKGWDNIEYSNMDSTSASVIQAGSSIDIDGTIYVFDSNEAISGTPSAEAVNYVVFYVSGGGALAKYSDEVLSDYDYDKKGFYNASTERLHMRFYFNGSSEYSEREILKIEKSVEPLIYLNFQSLNEKQAILEAALRVGQITTGGTYVPQIRSPIFAGGYGNAGSVACFGYTNSSLSNGIYYTQDGINWTFDPYSGGNGVIRGVVPKNGPHAYAGVDLSSTNNFIAATTLGGLSLAGTPLPFSTTTGQAIAWSDSLNLYVVGGNSGSVATSPDGVTWTSRTSGVSDDWNDATFGQDVFVMVADNGTIITSDDGVTWTSRTSGTAEALRHVVYGNGVFVAVGANNTVCVSTDKGATWTASSSYLNDTVDSLTFGINYFVAGKGDSDTVHTYYSLDGVTWYKNIRYTYSSVVESSIGFFNNVDFGYQNFIGVANISVSGGTLYYEDGLRF